jgi:hypothetical protein
VTMSVDIPRAWEICRATPMEQHDPRCSYRQLGGGGLLCDCHVLTQHPEFLDDVLQTCGGVPYRKPSPPDPEVTP